jgi:hypothetical protein
VKWGSVVEGDIHDQPHLADSIKQHSAIAVLHFAASRLVGESVSDPEKYYRNNVEGTLSLLRAMRQTQCKTLAFPRRSWGRPDWNRKEPFGRFCKSGAIVLWAAETVLQTANSAHKRKLPPTGRKAGACGWMDRGEGNPRCRANDADQRKPDPQADFMSIGPTMRVSKGASVSSNHHALFHWWT